MNVFRVNHVRSEGQIEMKRNYVRLLIQILHCQIETMVGNLNLFFENFALVLDGTKIAKNAKQTFQVIQTGRF